MCIIYIHTYIHTYIYIYVCVCTSATSSSFRRIIVRASFFFFAFALFDFCSGAAVDMTTELQYELSWRETHVELKSIIANISQSVKLKQRLVHNMCNPIMSSASIQFRNWGMKSQQNVSLLSLFGLFLFPAISLLFFPSVLRGLSQGNWNILEQSLHASTFAECPAHTAIPVHQWQQYTAIIKNLAAITSSQYTSQSSCRWDSGERDSKKVKTSITIKRN